MTKHKIVIITMNNEYDYSGPDLLLDLIAVVTNKQYVAPALTVYHFSSVKKIFYNDIH